MNSSNASPDAKSTGFNNLMANNWISHLCNSVAQMNIVALSESIVASDKEVDVVVVVNDNVIFHQWHG